MRSKRWLAMSLLAVATMACYHQVIQTGLTPGTPVIDMGNVNTGIFGLAGAQVDVRTQCPSGVAIVETEESFVNAVLTIITIGIYTPRHVTVTCASRTASLPQNGVTINVASDATAAERDVAFRSAVTQSIARGEPVVVRF
ncbi:MAG: hypothetical protein ABI625_06250 [bacterium]